VKIEAGGLEVDSRPRSRSRLSLVVASTLAIGPAFAFTRLAHESPAAQQFNSSHFLCSGTALSLYKLKFKRVSFCTLSFVPAGGFAFLFLISLPTQHCHVFSK
jgi:hypothetical protein